MTIYLFKHANYYNRIIKRYETIDEYQDNAELVTWQVNTNFIPNNEITASQIVNMEDDGLMPDYFIVTQNTGEIVSRWYITESIRMREGQYNFKLYRDVIADWYDKVVTAPAFIEKATLGVNDPLIFNREDMSYNQIKQTETAIKDESGVPWYSVYCKPELNATINIPAKEIYYDEEVSNINTYKYYGYRDNDYYVRSGNENLVVKVFRKTFGIAALVEQYYIGYNIERDLSLQTPISFGKCHIDGVSKENGWFDQAEGYRLSHIIGALRSSALSIRGNILKNTTPEELISSLPAYVPYAYNEDPTSLDGRIIFDSGTNTYYKMNVNEVNAQKIHNVIPAGSEIFRKLDKAVKESSWYANETGGVDLWYYEAYYRTFRFSFVELNDFTSTMNITNTRRHSLDAPYDVIMIPGDGMICRQQSITQLTQTSQEFAMEVINALMSNEDASKYIYDIQRVPYTTLPSAWFKKYPGSSLVDIDDLDEGLDYAAATKDGNTLGFVFFPQSINANKTITKRVIEQPSDPIELKVANECDVYRIVSPNFNGQFEFSAAKNGGISGYTISTTLIPYTPYIKVAPIFGELYGQTFNDARGMICSGDFSITQKSSEWANYKYNNKNYQEMFDRQIQNMEINNKFAAIQEGATAITGTVSGAVNGGIGGAMVGGGWGAAAGAIAGGGAAAVGGIADVIIGKRLRQEAIDYAKDNFGYQLGNIKAIPYNITKLSAMSADNKIFPILEYYTATEEEKQALRDKITYNGMSVGKIGQVVYYQQEEPTYIKGKIIRLEDLGEGFLVANTIANELNQGVYI